MDRFTSSTTIEHPVQRLQELIESTSAEEASSPQTFGAKLVIPVAIRFWGGEGPDEANTHRLRDISAAGIVITSNYQFTENETLSVELCVNNTVWQDRMRVASVNKLAGGWRIELESTGDSPDHGTDGTDPALADPTRQFQKMVREREWLSQVKEDIRKATGAYLLARRSLGLLGTSVERQIARVVAAMPGEPAAASQNERRRHKRRHSHGDTHVVTHGGEKWRLIAAQIVDVSSGGLRITLPAGPKGKSAGTSGPGIELGTPVVIGLGSDPNILWVPGEVVRVEPDDGGGCSFGLQFVTGKSLQAFS